MTTDQVNELLHQTMQLEAELLIIKDIIKNEDLRTTHRHQAAAEGHNERIAAILENTRTIHI